MSALKKPAVKLTYAADINSPEEHGDRVYTVLAKDNFRWRTILPRTEDIQRARLKMTEAGATGKYDRVIICEAVNNPDVATFKWETVECALNTKDAETSVKLAYDAKQNLKCLDTGLCRIPAPANMAFGRRIAANSSVVISDKTAETDATVSEYAEYA